MLVEFTIGVVCIFVYYYVKFHHTWKYWEHHNVPFVKPSFPFGSSPTISWETFTSPQNFNQTALNEAKKRGFPKVYGTYFFHNPIISICDPELAKHIMVKDFDHFVDRQGEFLAEHATTSHLVDQLWGRQMTALRGDQWKATRNAFTPIFTGGKLKGMIHFIHEVTHDLVTSIGQEADRGTPFELKEKFGRFSMDTIASCAFGVKANSFQEDKSTFAMNAGAMFRNSPMDLMKFVLLVAVPRGRALLECLGVPLQKKAPTMFLYDIITQTVDHRLRTKTRRNDLVDLMIDAMKADPQSSNHPEEPVEDSQFDKDAKLNAPDFQPLNVDEMTLVATAMVILVAGYDTTAQTLAIASFHLARNPDIQEKLHQEIMDAVATMEDDKPYPDYNLIQSLPYLDMVLHETLRINPALGLISRTCTKDYIIPGTNIPLKCGQDAHIYVSAIHMNPDIYPDPKKFDPERFTKESKANRHPYSFLGFGQGPKNCIGMRFALLEAKLALFGVLRSYKFVTCPETIDTYTLDPSSILATPKEPLLVKVEKRK
uniref:Cytochrome P450 CYP3026A1 n=1 Tax=Tigriopus japonicus TaxID=158387 RepID=A0A088DKR3_TIGJA|nr:cytochrome P450 CYP3026A1 [Tigriopus japonicus]